MFSKVPQMRDYKFDTDQADDEFFDRHPYRFIYLRAANSEEVIEHHNCDGMRLAVLVRRYTGPDGRRRFTRRFYLMPKRRTVRARRRVFEAAQKFVADTELRFRPAAHC